MRSGEGGSGSIRTSTAGALVPAPFLHLPVRAIRTGNERLSSEDCLSRTPASSLRVLSRDEIIQGNHARISFAVRFLTFFHSSD